MSGKIPEQNWVDLCGTEYKNTWWIIALVSEYLSGCISRLASVSRTCALVLRGALPCLASFLPPDSVTLVLRGHKLVVLHFVTLN